MSTRIKKKRYGGMDEGLEPRKQPVQERSRITVDLILTAAAQVFETYGYAAGTTNRMAERAGVSIGTLYQYFPGKEALAIALLEKHINDTEKKLLEWVSHMVSQRHALKEALTDYVKSIMEVHEKRPRLQHILLEEIPLPLRLHEVMRSAEQRAIATFSGFLRLHPEVNRNNLDRSGYFVIHTVESLTHRYAAHPGERMMDRDDFIGELVEMLLSYLAGGENHIPA